MNFGMASPKKYEFFDHTADIGMTAFGRDLKELFANSAEGMFEILGRASFFKPKEKKEIQVTSNNQEDLLHKWLAELLFVFEKDKIFFVEFDIKSLSDKQITALVKGESYLGKEAQIKTEIKAVTYHQFKVKKVNGRFEARVIFDI